MLKKIREESGVSQRGLARRAGVAYKTIQLIESGRDCRWSTLSKLAKALNRTDPRELLAKAGGRTAAETAFLIDQAAKGDWLTPFFDFVDDFRRAPDPCKIAQAPGPGSSPRAMALVAATVESLCAEQEIASPWWCSAAPTLERPWFVSGVEGLKASALIECPAAFRQRNVFVLGNFLSRA